MGNKVQGKNIGGYLKVSGVYFPVFCGQTLTFQTTQDIIETSTVTSGSWRDYEAGMSTSVMNITGVTILDNTENRISDGYLFQQSIRQQKQDWKITKTDDDGDILVYTFQGIIQEIGFDKNIGSYSKSNLTVQVCGPVTVDTVEPPDTGDEVIYSDWWNFTAGATSISGTSVTHSYNLIDVTVLEVDREGMEHNLIDTGSPIGRQCKHDDTAGSITFDAAIPSNGETVFVLFKRVL